MKQSIEKSFLIKLLITNNAIYCDSLDVTVQVYCLIDFTWDIGQYVYCNCLLFKLRRHKFWNWSRHSYQVIFLHDQKLRIKIEVSQERTAEAIVWSYAVQKVFLEILWNSQENAFARVSFIKKETLARVFSCEFC